MEVRSSGPAHWASLEAGPGEASVHVLTRASTDADLLDSLAQDRPRAAAMLYDRYAPEVNRLVWRLLGADPDHDDLVQQVFCRLLIKAGTVRDVSRLPAYVRRVTINTVTSELRKRAVYRRFFRSGDDFDRFESLTPDPEKSALLRRTYSILQQLPVAERLAFSLRFLDGRSLEEVAELCDCSLATAKRRIAKASTRFRTLVERDSPGGTR